MNPRISRKCPRNTNYVHFTPEIAQLKSSPILSVGEVFLKIKNVEIKDHLI